MNPSNPIILYDIASGPPVRGYAPSPWKARYALNFKGVHYKTEWVELLEVTSMRKRLGAAPNRLLPDGSDFYTLPVIKDLSNNGEIVGESFDIALYLDKTYPDGPRLIPPGCIGIYKAFDIQMYNFFVQFITLNVHGMPFNPASAERDRKQFSDRAGGIPWEDLGATGDARKDLWDKFHTALGDLARAFKFCDGPFLEGDVPTYADLNVGAWLQMHKATLSSDEWNTLCEWHDGLWGNLHKALEKYAKNE